MDKVKIALLSAAMDSLGLAVMTGVLAGMSFAKGETVLALILAVCSIINAINMESRYKLYKEVEVK